MSVKQIATRCAAATASALLVSSCGQILGVADYTVSAEHDAEIAVRYRDAACGECMAGCADERTQCERDTVCATYANCAFACDRSNGACARECQQKLTGR